VLHRVEAVEVAMGLQEVMLTNLRRADRNVRADGQAAKKAASVEAQQQFIASQARVESEKNLSLLKKSFDSEKGRNSELKNRCDDLTSQLEKERKQRSVCVCLKLHNQ
jgi:hypothetical protein